MENKGLAALDDSRGEKLAGVVFMVLVSVLIFIPPYLRGLYFNKEIIPIHIFSFLLFGFYVVLKLFKEEDIKFNTVLDYAVIGLIIAYIIPIIFGQAVNIRAAIGEVIKYLNFAVLFLIVSDISKDIKKLKILLNVLVGSGFGVAVLGIDAAAGEKITSVINSFFAALFGNSDTLKIFGGYADNAINSTLQYKNACAAFLAAVFFITISLLINSTKKWTRAIYGAIAVILVSTMVLTYSRGVYIIFIAALVLNIFSAPNGSKIDTLLNNICILMSSFFGIALGKIPNNITIANDSTMTSMHGTAISKIWIWILVSMVLGAVLVLAVSYILKFAIKLSNKTYAVIAVIAVLVFGSIVGVVATTTKPLVLNHDLKTADSLITSQKKVVLDPGEYKLSLNINAKNTSKKPWVWQVQVYTQSLSDMLMQKPGTLLYTKQGTKSTKLKDNLKIPNDSKTVLVSLSNNFSGTQVSFDKLKFISKKNKVEDVVLSYKYLPQSISDKIQDINANTRNVIERSYYSKDAFKIIKDHPIVGAGGGAWAELYFKYQSYLYFTTQAHNFIAQLAIETGAIGVLVYIVLLLGLIYAVFNYFIDIYKHKFNGERYRIISGIVPAVFLMIVHSAVDFDLSLAAVFMTLWLFIAILNGYMKLKYESHIKPVKVKTKTQSDNKIAINSDKLIKLRTFNFNKLAALVMVLVIVVYSICLEVGYVCAQNGIVDLKANNLVAARSSFETSINSDPLQADSKMELAGIYLSQLEKNQNIDLFNKTKKLIDSSIKLEKYNPTILINGTSNYFKMGQIDKALNLIDQAVKAQPMNANNYEQKAIANLSAVQYFLQLKDNAKAKPALDEIINIKGELDAAKKRSITDFEPTQKTLQMIDQAKSLKKTLFNHKNAAVIKPQSTTNTANVNNSVNKNK